MNGDSYCGIEVVELAAEQAASGRVTRFLEQRAGAGPGWVNAGVYVLSTRLLAELPAATPLSLETRVFPEWAEDGSHAFARPARFIDIGTPESYALAQQYFMETGGAPSKTDTSC